jgi:hypothetical protein
MRGQILRPLEDREEALKIVYKLSNGSTITPVGFTQIHQKLGWPNVNDVADVLKYYQQKGLLDVKGFYYTFTSKGIDYFEGAMFKEKISQTGKCSIFISRIEKHKDIADKLKQFLIDKFPKNLSVFVANDPDNIPLYDDWFEDIKDGIKNCDRMIILCTPDSVVRPWINFEAGAATILGKKIGFICFGGQSPGSLPSPIINIRVQAIDCSDDTHFQKHFNKLIEIIANQIGISVPDVNVLNSKFYQAIKLVQGPSLSAIMSASSYNVGESIVIRGNVENDLLEHIPNVTVNLYKFQIDGTGFEKRKETIIPLKSDNSFEAIIKTDDLIPGSYGAIIQLPSGGFTKVSFHINDRK